MQNFFPTLIITYLSAYSQVLSKPNFDYFKSFIWASILIKGRKCITNISKTCFYLEKHFSSFERFFSQNKWDINKLIKVTIDLLLKHMKDKFMIHNGFLSVIDTTLISKNSKKLSGVQKWSQHSSNADRGNYICGHQWSILGLISNCLNRIFCFPILTRLVSGHNNPYQYVSDTNKIRPGCFFDTAISMVFQLQGFLGNDLLRVVSDAFYSKSSFIQPLLDKGIHVITRLRKDAVGWEKPIQNKGRGRPRKHGKKWKLAELLKLPSCKEVKVNIYGKLQTVKAISKDLFLRDISQIVRIVVVEGVHKPAIFVSTDLSLSMESIIEIYSRRFSVELAIKDLKQTFGICNYQFSNNLSVFRFVQLCCISFCIWRLFGINSKDLIHDTYDNQNKAPIISFSRIGKFMRRFVISKILFSNSAINTEVEKINDNYKNIFKIVS